MTENIDQEAREIIAGTEDDADEKDEDDSSTKPPLTGPLTAALAAPFVAKELA